MFGQESQHIYGGSAEFLEELYQQYLKEPASVDEKWRGYFDLLQSEGADSPGQEISEAEIQRFCREQSRIRAAGGLPQSPGQTLDMYRKQSAVLRLIHAYRLLGHLRAAVDPIRLRAMPEVPDLDPAFHGLTDADMELTFSTGNLGGKSEMTLREIIEMLKETYTEHIGCEFMHVSDVEEKRWLQSRLESTRTNPNFSNDYKIFLLERLTAAEGLEQYLHTRYSGQKRFSLEGAETLITALDEIVQRGGEQGVEEIVIGMAHRGRLDVLVNVLGKSPRELFEEFEGKHEWKRGVTGDVKYHSGYSADVQTKGGAVHLTLGFNPSHLEIIDPVTMGSVRSRQDRRGDRERRRVMGVLIHGDAAFAGQGVVYETLNLSETRGYGTGGTIHVVVNNRIGFTTSHPKDVRSALYCTDVGKVIQAPIFHVNGDDPEAVAFIMQMAVNWRMTFKRDVIVDVVCYRRHGHNEADEPAATQPMMYKLIRSQPTTHEIYARKLVAEGVVTAEAADAMVANYRKKLEAGQQVALGSLPTRRPRNEWNKYAEAKWTDPVETAMPVQEIKRIGTQMATPPGDFQLHDRVVKIMDDRLKMAAGALPIDWGFAEIMAYAGLLKDGFGVRISGQDSGRGTFFHRHAVMMNMRDGDEYVPLQHLFDGQPKFTVIDSMLSEEAVLGFEYGYNAADPKTLVIWEAQFGDFANGAQVVIDQFIAAAEQKWNLLTPLTLFLPHGWEGQGAEHSSARLERYLQLCAQENMQVCYPSTPAQMFHLLRRQMLRNYRKPLIVMTPKSPLRRKITFSSLEDFSMGTFQNVIGEIDHIKPDNVRRVVVCSGKIYWDLLEARRERNAGNVALLRLEQIYPFPQEELAAQIGQYAGAPEVCWCQEEPQNQGAWYTIQSALRTCMLPEQNLVYAGRVAAAAPAGGDYQKYLERQKKVVDDALTLRAAARQDAAAASQRPQLV